MLASRPIMNYWQMFCEGLSYSVINIILTTGDYSTFPFANFLLCILIVTPVLVCQFHWVTTIVVITFSFKQFGINLRPFQARFFILCHILMSGVKSSLLVSYLAIFFFNWKRLHLDTKYIVFKNWVLRHLANLTKNLFSLFKIKQVLIKAINQVQ